MARCLLKGLAKKKWEGVPVDKWVTRHAPWRAAWLYRACAIVMALCSATPAFARDQGNGPFTQSPSKNPQADSLLSQLSGVRIDDHGLAHVYGRGLTTTPHASGQVAVILWDERGAVKTGGGDVFAAQSSLGQDNVQTNRLTQN